MKSYFVIVVTFCFLLPVFGQRKITAMRIGEKIVVDGKMDEEAWQNAEVSGGFTQTNPNVGKPSSQYTDFRITYDDFHLYLYVRCFDDMDKISKVLCQRDGFDANTDYVTLILDTYNDDQNGFAFGVSNLGVQYDAKLFVNSWMRNLDMAWHSDVAFFQDHWAVEMKIPYSAFRFPRVDVQNWGINVFRNISRVREFSAWNPSSPDFENELAQCGDLLGIYNITPPFRLSLMPYSSFYAEHQKNPNTQNNWGYSLNGGMDIKYGINDAFTLDMTLIPDFGQVQFDPEILNLTPFEVQFIDYRQFFTEGNELFNKSGLFYSRRIGGRPIGYRNVQNQLDSGEFIISNPISSQLYNASKVSGRTKKGLGIGVFNGLSATTFAEVGNDLGETRRIVTSPLTNYNLLVLDQNLKNNSYITLTNANVMRSGYWRDANLTAIHSKVNTSDNRFFVSGNFNLSQRYEFDGNTFGQAIAMSAGKQRGQFIYNFRYAHESDNYDQNELGFLLVNNMRTMSISTAYTIFKPFWKLNRYWARANISYQRLYNPDNFIATFLSTSTGVTDKRFHSYGVSFTSNLVESNDFFEPRSWGATFIRPANVRYGYWISSNYQKKLAIDVNTYTMTFLNRDSWQDLDFLLSVRWRMNDKIFLIASYNQNITNNEQGFAIRNFGQNPFPGVILFGQRDKLTSISTIDFRYTMTNRMGITFMLRHYWANVEYDSYFTLNNSGRLDPIDFDGKNDEGRSMYNTNYNAFTIDMVYRWIFAPASEVNVVWKNALFNTNELTQLNYFSNIQDMFDRNPMNSLSVRIIYFFDTIYLKKLSQLDRKRSRES